MSNYRKKDAETGRYRTWECVWCRSDLSDAGDLVWLANFRKKNGTEWLRMDVTGPNDSAPWVVGDWYAL